MEWCFNKSIGTNSSSLYLKYLISILSLKKKNLKLDFLNEVSIVFKNKYSSDGTGLHSYVDSDGKQYLYS
jgi:hypothetical protein